MNIQLLISIFVTSYIAIYLLVRFAERFGLIDIPNERSMHQVLIPRGAGIPFILSVFFVLLVFDLDYLKTYYYVYLAIAIVFIVGVWDDYKNISPKIKFIFIFLKKGCSYCVHIFYY